MAQGGILHTFGSGHSSLVAAEIVGRSGALVPVNQIIDRSEDLAERLEGYGLQLMEFYHQQYQLKAGEVVIIISNSGINPLPIEVALSAKSRELKVISISNVSQSRQSLSRHSSQKKLFELADISLDSYSPIGEAAFSHPEGYKLGTIASLTSLFIINLLMVESVEGLLERSSPPIFISENAPFKHSHYSSADDYNKALRLRYQGRLRRAGV